MRFSKSPLAGILTVTNADVISNAIDISQDYGFAFQAIWTGSSPLVGTVKVQSTVDGNTWSDIPNTTQNVNGAGSFLWNVNGAFYSKARVYFTYTSGNGTIEFWASTKGP